MSPDLATGLATEHRTFRVRAAGRRSLAPSCHVGCPGGERITLPVPSTADAGLGEDLVVRAIDGLRNPELACAWLARVGELDPEEVDLAWLTAARGGFARHGLVLPAFFVVTRKGWRDMLTGHTELLRGAL